MDLNYVPLYSNIADVLSRERLLENPDGILFVVDQNEKSGNTDCKLKAKKEAKQKKRIEKELENFDFLTCEELIKSETYLLKMSQKEWHPS